jgi:DNA-binding NarL/FixJ family response regulator
MHENIDESFLEAEIALAMDELPEGQVAVISLVYAGFQQKHIVTLLGVSRATVGAHKKNAINALAGQLRAKPICSSYG